MDHIEALRTAFQAVQHSHPFAIDAVVILPEHFHIVMTLAEDDADFSTRLRLIKSRFTSAVDKTGASIAHRGNGERTLWQRRFWEHTIRDERDFERHVDYIHFNPIKHRLVTRACDWPHSSFHQYVARGVLPEDWAGDASAPGGNFGEPS